jgi:hypothetical protein
MNEVKLPAEAKENNLPPECGQSIDMGDERHVHLHYIINLERALFCVTNLEKAPNSNQDSSRCTSAESILRELRIHVRIYFCVVNLEKAQNSNQDSSMYK